MKVKILCPAFALLACAAFVGAYPFPGLPQCGPYPLCSDGCYFPPSPKCAVVAVSLVNDDQTAVVCTDSGDATGSGLLGICIADPILVATRPWPQANR